MNFFVYSSYMIFGELFVPFFRWLHVIPKILNFWQKSQFFEEILTFWKNSHFVWTLCILFLDGSWVDVTGLYAQKASEYIEVLTGDFSDVHTDKMPFPHSLKAPLLNGLGGYFQMVIQFKFGIILLGLEKDDEMLTVLGKDENRLDCNGLLLLLTDIMEKNETTGDPNGIKEKDAVFLTGSGL